MLHTPLIPSFFLRFGPRYRGNDRLFPPRINNAFPADAAALLERAEPIQGAAAVNSSPILCEEIVECSRYFELVAAN